MSGTWAYVDESGCIGMKIGSGSSAFFAVCAVLFSSREQVTACYNKIEQLKSELCIRRKEFKFSKCSHEVRVRFFMEMKQFDFCYFGLVIDKAQITGFSRPFLHSAVLMVFALHSECIKNATVVIDKTGSDAFRKMMARKLKEDLNRQCDRSIILKVKSVESHKHNLLQLADMICGAVARSYHPQRQGKHTYRSIISQKKRGILLLP